MYTDLISKEYFLFKFKHAELEFIKEVAKKVIEIMLVNVNLDQTREDLIKTLYAIFYKVRGELPENGLLAHDDLNTFSYDAHFNCPFEDESDLKRYYMKLVDHYGFNKKFNRLDARDLLEAYSKEIGYTYNSKTLIYRVFQRVQAKHPMFAKFYGDKKHIMLYPVEKWTDDNKPVFKEVTND